MFWAPESNLHVACRAVQRPTCGIEVVAGIFARHMSSHCLPSAQLEWALASKEACRNRSDAAGAIPLGPTLRQVLMLTHGIQYSLLFYALLPSLGILCRCAIAQAQSRVQPIWAY